MQSFRTKGKISHILLAINTIPLVILGLLTVFFSLHWFSDTMHREIEIEMKNVASCIRTSLDLLYPGDYEFQADTCELYKGGYNLSWNYALIDSIKTGTEFEITIFYGDTRALTTIRDMENQRITGTTAPENAVEKVLRGGESSLYNDTFINNSTYFSYYEPLYNPDKTIVGMLFVGKPNIDVNVSVRNAILPLLFINVLTTVMIVLFNYVHTRKIASALSKIHAFLSQISIGNLSTRLDASLLNRKDELGEMGLAAMRMQKSLSSMIELDALTGIYNRRFAESKLRQLISVSSSKKEPFCIAIGDIDFFKSVNDTYGHEGGDTVLKLLAACLKRHIDSQGFVARFGGEEFLLVYKNKSLREALSQLQKLSEEIRNMECIYEGHTIHITMTFGITEGVGHNMTHLLRIADNLLYRGKENGRNRIES